jgi:hypothetical protein
MNRTYEPCENQAMPVGHHEDIFAAQARFMQMSKQVPGEETFALYHALIKEEMKELNAAVSAGDEVEVFDALCDLMVVVAGAGVAKRLPMRAGMREVYRSNFSKFDLLGRPWATREDGKVVKDSHFVEPDLAGVMTTAIHL